MYKMCRISFSVLILCLILHQAHQNEIAKVETKVSNTHFDVIVLSQEWPVTVCKFWKYTLNPGEDVGCVFPKKKNQWITHGIWPRTMGGKYIEFCNKSWTLDPKQLKPIKEALLQAQPEVYKELHYNVFWRHEWRKHGTCAVQLEPLNTQLKYFSKSIEWNRKYSISAMLEAANIFPSDTTYVEVLKVSNAVKAVTKKIPELGCFIIDEVVYLQEVRICLDTEFNVMDCTNEEDKYCNSAPDIIYPATA